MSGTGDCQQTLSGDVIEQPPSYYPLVDTCDVCGKQAVLDGVLGMEHGGQALCHRGCFRETVAFVVHCECCGWFNEIQGTEFGRYAARQRAQQERNSHESTVISGRVPRGLTPRVKAVSSYQTCSVRLMYRSTVRLLISPVVPT